MPSATDVFILLVWLAEVVSVAYVAYRTALGLLSLRTPKPVAIGSGTNTFLIIIPSHNEESVIADTIASIQRVIYPDEKRLICVIADDCTDGTAQAARAAGAQVLEKSTPAIGKGETIQ